MARQYADYEYKIDGHRLRVEKYSDGWRWMVLWADGEIETETDQGDYSRIKRDALLGGKRYLNSEKHKHTMKEERDYKKEYAKFQSSPKRKKYRAELNKYNRNKGTYGNGDGKDASHKGGKISGYETESKNRGRREKSRKKGSTRKTETVMPTLREFITQEVNAELDERLSKRWNIVEAGKDPVQAIVNQKAIERAVKKGDAKSIQKIIGKAATYRRELARKSHMTGTIRQIRHVDGVIQNLVRILVHVKQGGVTEVSGNRIQHQPRTPAGKAQIAIMKALQSGNHSGTIELADLIQYDPTFRGIHFAKIQKAASVLKKKGLIKYDGISRLALEGQAWGKPEPAASAIQSKEIDPNPVSTNRMGG